jgi:hypothetical protein
MDFSRWTADSSLLAVQVLDSPAHRASCTGAHKPGVRFDACSDPVGRLQQICASGLEYAPHLAEVRATLILLSDQ